MKNIIQLSTFLSALFWFAQMSAQTPVNDVNDNNDCALTSMHCWPTVYLTAGTLNCTAYNPSLDDHFSNLSNWNTYYEELSSPNSRTHHPCEEQIFRDQNVVIQNNKCVLKGEYAPNTQWTWPDIPMNPMPTSQTYTRNFNSGVISAKQFFHFGSFETTIEDMPGNGWWPAFWMWHHEEIDIMERFWSADEYSYNTYPAFKCKQSNTYKRENGSVSFYDGPHTFKAEWTPFKLTFYYNGQALPKVIYRYYKFDGTPLDINCGDNIPEGLFYVNPNFIQPWRDYANNSTEATAFRPIINLAVLPKYGFGACGPNTTISCNNPNPDCVNWGNPVDDNGNEIPGFEKNTNLTISNVLIQERTYRACGSIALTYNPIACENEPIEVIVEDFENTNANIFGQTHLVNITNVTSSSKLLHVSTVNHKIIFKPLGTGFATFTISYTDECGNAKTVTRDIQIKNANECKSDFCTIAPNLENCCPDNTLFDGYNCLYKSIPAGYNPMIINGEFYVQPNLSISTVNHGCPLDYVFDGQNCNSGVKIPEGSEGFTGPGGFYVRPNCGDIRDCCPRGGFVYDGANCYSGVSYPAGYSGFIWNNTFYVSPNCQISTANNCCPAGFNFDGANCYSGVHIPSYTTGFILDNKFYVKPYCEDPNDCCPVGSKFDGANCWFADSPRGSGEGFIRGNKFYVEPVNNTCPEGYERDEYGCFSGITFPSNYEGFYIYHEGEEAFNGFYVTKKCPGEELCCPPEGVYELANQRCWYGDLPQGYQPFILGNSFYVRPNCTISTTNNCCPEGFAYDGANCRLENEFANGLTPYFTDEGFYSSSYCDDGFTGTPMDERLQHLGITTDLPATVSLSPNPSANSVNLRFSPESSDALTVRLLDAVGVIKQEFRLNDISNSSTLNVSLTGYPSGVYYFILDNGTKQEVLRFVKL